MSKHQSSITLYDATYVTIALVVFLAALAAIIVWSAQPARAHEAPTEWLSAPTKRPLNPHPCVLNRMDEGHLRSVDAGVSGTDAVAPIHRIGPALAVVIWPVVKKEIRCLARCANQLSKFRVAEGNRDGASKSIRVHGSPYPAIAAEVSALVLMAIAERAL